MEGTMAGPYDSVVSIGGQSFIDGLWRIFGPALEGLTNPLPLAIPGFANAQMRITQLEPVIPGNPPPSGALQILATVEVVAEALLRVTTTTDSLKIEIDSLKGALSSLKFTAGAVNVGTGAGTLTFPDPTLPPPLPLAGTGKLLSSVPNVPGIPLPAVIPVAVDLTPSGPLVLPATVVLTVSGPSIATRFGLAFQVGSVSVGAVGGIDPNLAANLTPILQNAVNQIVSQLGILPAIPQVPVDQNAIGTLVGPIPGLVAQAFDDALTRLLAETGRLTFPTPGAGASCDVKVLPTGADAQLVASATGAYVLQVGFKRATSTDIPTFPAVGPGAVECTVLVGNSLILEMLCCLVERLPAFALPVAAATSTIDVAGGTHLRCCNFTGVTATFAGITIGGGGISVCVNGTLGRPKTFSIVGSFTQGVPTTLPIVGTIATIRVGFTLPVMFDLEDASAIANLRFTGAPAVAVTVSPNIAALAAAALIIALLGLIGFTFGGGGFFGAIIGAIFGLLTPIALVIVIFLLVIACDAANYLIGNAVRTVLGGASLLRSPVAIPPGLFEAFGRLAPATVTVDDLTANGVLHTPTSPWALLPRIGPKRLPPPKGDERPPVKDPNGGDRQPPPPRGKGKSSATARPARRSAKRTAKS
jgi:hypothetical protein